MGAYGSPELWPENNQGPNKKGKTGIIHSDLPIWKKVLLILYLIVLAFFSLMMFLTLETYTGNKIAGVIIAAAFLTLGILFVTRISTHKKAWPFVLLSVVAFFTYFGVEPSSPSTPAAVQSQSSYNKANSSTSNASSKLNAIVSSKAKSTTTSKSKPTSSTTAQDEAVRYKSQCSLYKYKEIARNPNDYKGKKAKVTGQVVQIEESWGSDMIRLNVTKDQYGLWSDTIYIDYTPKSENESRILENDIITVYGELNGIKTYTTVLGSSVSIPYLNANYVEISPESK